MKMVLRVSLRLFYEFFGLSCWIFFRNIVSFQTVCGHSILKRQSVSGRRIKKNVVGSYIVKYVYDGGHVIAEYDDSNLLRKYIYGARVDEPVCMLENPASDGIDVAANNAAYLVGYLIHLP